VAEACAQLEFRYAATADQFLTIAKLRAARRLWARVAEVCGAPDAGAQRQHAVTSTVMMTRRDPWVNMLRTTVATLAAGVGGAESVTVLPFDEALGLPDAFARRIARNTSTVLIEESHLARVVDPAGGSWYVERLTDELAHAAWEFFQVIERAGGQEAALRSGTIGERLAETWSARSRKLATRREPITGVSEFPHLTEKPVERTPAPAQPTGGLPRVRRDEAYEALRARSDAHLAATGTRPRVYLAALGPAAAHSARVSFAANLFQAGGIEPVTEGTFEESGAREVCLCSSDALYAEQAATAAAELRAAGAEHVLLAGRPADHPGAAACHRHRPRRRHGRIPGYALRRARRPVPRRRAGGVGGSPDPRDPGGAAARVGPAARAGVACRSGHGPGGRRPAGRGALPGHAAGGGTAPGPGHAVVPGPLAVHTADGAGAPTGLRARTQSGAQPDHRTARLPPLTRDLVESRDRGARPRGRGRVSGLR
ncbi:methylmalonyl-CoA mutase family protein, partial [Streptomyces massasporeus]